MREPTKHVVMFSGGVGSFETAWRIVQRHGRSAVTLLFTDTLHEDADLYRFLVESAAFITGRAGVGEVSGLSALAANTPPVWERDARKAHIANVRALAATVLPQLVWLVDGRDIWEVFASERYLGNSQVGICTDRLKQTMRDGWMAAHCDPSNTVCYVGIDWTEIHRFEGESEPDVEDAGQIDVFGVVPTVDVAPGRKRRPGLRKKMAERGWCYEAPLCEAPYIAKYEVFDHLRAVGIQAPRLYGYGFAHNNCFHGDTRFITESGIRTLRESVGETVRVLGAGAGWKEAQIQSFGEQPLVELVVERFGKRKTILTTADHRWFLRVKRTQREERLTGALQPGDALFSMQEHRERYSRFPLAQRPPEFRVVEIRPTDRVEEVFCAVVPDGHAFALEDNILTGNCGGGCVKAGIGHFAHLHRALPDVFAHWEREETRLRGVLGDVSILSDRRGGGGKKPLPLASLRARIEAGETIDMDEVGGCGCFIDTEGAA